MNPARPWRVVEGGVLLAVRATPKASRTEVVGIVDAGDGRLALALRIAAPPVEGAANETLIAWFAKALRLRKADVSFASGETGRLKLLRLAGDPVAIEERLNALV